MDDEALADKIAKILDSPIRIVYFLRCGKYVKIGTTKGRLLKRIADLQVGNPYEIKLDWFILGSNETEKKLHKKLENYWVRGEWHKINKREMLNLIKGI